MTYKGPRGPLPPFGALLGPLGALSGPLGALLGVPWSPLGAPRSPLGVPWIPLEGPSGLQGVGMAPEAPCPWLRHWPCRGARRVSSRLAHGEMTLSRPAQALQRGVQSSQIV